MALATVKTGDTATAAQYNALVNLLNGAAGAENPVVLADNIAGTLQLKPTNDPGSVVELVQVNNAAGTRLAAIRSDGGFLSTVAPSFAGLNTTTLIATSNATIAGNLNVGGTFLATGAATLSGALNVVGTTVIGTLPTVAHGQLNVGTAGQAMFDLQNTTTGATPSAGSHWRLFADNQGGGGGNMTVGLFDVNNAATRFGIDNTGNVGIGTTAPAAMLDVNGGLIARSAATLGGTLNVTGQTTLATLIASGTVSLGSTLNVTGVTTLGSLIVPHANFSSVDDDTKIAISNDFGSNGFLTFAVATQGARWVSWGNSLELMKLTNAGNLGILNSTPAAALHVGGGLIATGAASLGSTLNVAGTLTGAGRISSNAVGASGKTLTYYVPINPDASHTTTIGPTTGPVTVKTAVTLTGLPASAVAVSLLVNVIPSNNPGLFTASLYHDTGAAQEGIGLDEDSSVAGHSYRRNGDMAVTPGATNQIAYTLSCPGAMIWSMTLAIQGYYEAS